MSEHTLPIYFAKAARELFSAEEQKAALAGQRAKQRLHLAAGGLNTLIGALGLPRLGEDVRKEATIAVMTTLRQIALRHKDKDRFADLILDKMQRDYANAEKVAAEIIASLKANENDLGDGPAEMPAATPAPTSSAQNAAPIDELPLAARTHPEIG